MKARTINLIVASLSGILFFGGWALRSSVPVNDWLFKPVGGVFMALGMVGWCWFLYRLLKKHF